MVEGAAKMIVRCVTVNRDREPQDAMRATGCCFYGNQAVIEAMPRGDGDEVEVWFFKSDRYMNDADLEREYKSHNLVPVDPYSLAAVNEADPAFADKYPNATHWRNDDDKWCYAAFYRDDDGRNVQVRHRRIGWSHGQWFAGLRQQS